LKRSISFRFFIPILFVTYRSLVYSYDNVRPIEFRHLVHKGIRLLQTATQYDHLNAV
jgi:hypothetical protein